SNDWRPRIQGSENLLLVIPAQAGQKRALRALNSRRLAPKGRAQRVTAFQQRSGVSNSSKRHPVAVRSAIPACAGMTASGEFESRLQATGHLTLCRTASEPAARIHSGQPCAFAGMTKGEGFALK